MAAIVIGTLLASHDRTMRLLAPSAVLLTLLALPRPALAAPHTHDGFYLRLGGGVGALEMSRSLETTGAGTSESDSSLGGLGPSFELILGGTPAAGLVVGGGLFTVTLGDPELDREQGDDVSLIADLNVVFVGAVVDFYPTPVGGLYLGGLAGVAGGAGEAPGEQSFTERVGGTGPGLSLHAGYDFWIGQEWSLGPELRLFGALVMGTDERESFTTEERSTLFGGSLLLTAAYH